MRHDFLNSAKNVWEVIVINCSHYYVLVSNKIHISSTTTWGIFTSQIIWMLLHTQNQDTFKYNRWIVKINSNWYSSMIRNTIYFLKDMQYNTQPSFSSQWQSLAWSYTTQVWESKIPLQLCWRQEPLLALPSSLSLSLSVSTIKNIIYVATLITPSYSSGYVINAPLHKSIDTFFSLVGCLMFITSGILIIEEWEGALKTDVRRSAIAKGSLAIVNGLLFLFDVFFTYRTSPVTSSASGF